MDREVCLFPASRLWLRAATDEVITSLTEAAGLPLSEFNAPLKWQQHVKWDGSTLKNTK